MTEPHHLSKLVANGFDPLDGRLCELTYNECETQCSPLRSNRASAPQMNVIQHVPNEQSAQEPRQKGCDIAGRLSRASSLYDKCDMLHSKPDGIAGEMTMQERFQRSTAGRVYHFCRKHLGAKLGLKTDDDFSSAIGRRKMHREFRSAFMTINSQSELAVFFGAEIRAARGIRYRVYRKRVGSVCSIV